jgi:hypothetical protein
MHHWTFNGCNASTVCKFRDCHLWTRMTPNGCFCHLSSVCTLCVRRTITTHRIYNSFRRQSGIFLHAFGFAKFPASQLDRLSPQLLLVLYRRSILAESCRRRRSGLRSRDGDGNNGVRIFFVGWTFRPEIQSKFVDCVLSFLRH